jgi:uncharacterized membrane protein
MTRVAPVALAGLLVVAAAAAAQEAPVTQSQAQPPAQVQPQGPGMGPDLSPAEIQRLFDAYTVMQAQEALRLSNDQYGAFVARLKVVQDLRRQQQQERARLLRELAQLAGPRAPEGDDAPIAERLRALRDHDTKSHAEIEKAYQELDQLLSVRQRARLRLLEESLERRKLELLMRARQGVRAQGPRRQGQGPMR